MAMYGLEGKVAIVTGAGRRAGLGEGMARRLAAEGCRVILCDLGATAGELFPAHGVGTTEELEAVAAGIREETGAEVRTHACDVDRKSVV